MLFFLKYSSIRDRSYVLRPGDCRRIGDISCLSLRASKTFALNDYLVYLSNPPQSPSIQSLSHEFKNDTRIGVWG